MARPVADRHRWLRLLAYGAAGLTLWLLSLAVVQTLLARRIARAQLGQLATEVAFSLRLGELVLERYPMETVAELSGLDLHRQPPRDTGAGPGRNEAAALHRELCDQLRHCRQVRAAERRLWVEMASPIEPVWLSTPIPQPRRWPPDSLSLGLSLVATGLALSTLGLNLEVRRPLRQLERSLQQLGSGQDPQRQPERGAAAVRRITAGFNALAGQLSQARQEQATMLAGIGHDLNSPITRLRLRLHLAETTPMAAADGARALADLDALERITAQFISFARGEGDEAPAPLDLAALINELAGQSGLEPLTLALQPLHARVQITAMARALTNLLDNARSHGCPPYRLQLRPWEADGFEIAVIDSGAGVDPALWPQLVQPFQRLDQARGGSGHCGLGLAIAARVALSHGGGLLCRRCPPPEPAGFAVLLRGRSLPLPPADTSGHISAGSSQEQVRSSDQDQPC
ncbi:MAG: ATP-binding protein [Cyanobium sp.]|nr:ATP-binding protein [Cyanobium sp.]